MDNIENKEVDIQENNIIEEEVVVPSLDNTEAENLLSVGIEEAIQKEGIDTVLLKEETEVHVPSYLMDMTSVGSIMPASLQALQTMLTENGDTAVYMKNGDMIGIIGYGDSQELYNRLDTYVNNVYSNKCKLYKNKGDGFKEVKPMDVDNIELDL